MEVKRIKTTAMNWSKKKGSNKNNKPKVLLVYFLGGVTHMEISALRLLNKQEHNGWKLLIATTNIVNGSSLLREMVDTSVNRQNGGGQ
jgi:hypothetical protein